MPYVYASCVHTMCVPYMSALQSPDPYTLHAQWGWHSMCVPCLICMP